MNNETVGITTVIVGVVIVVGAVRGTWKKIFQDVVFGQSSSASASGSASNSPNGGAGISIGPIQGLGADKAHCAVWSDALHTCVVQSWGFGYTQAPPGELIGANAGGIVYT